MVKDNIMKKIYVKPLMETKEVECEVIMSVSSWGVDNEPIIGPVGSPSEYMPFGIDDDIVEPD